MKGQAGRRMEGEEEGACPRIEGRKAPVNVLFPDSVNEDE